jgi:hypothetical protein
LFIGEQNSADISLVSGTFRNDVTDKVAIPAEKTESAKQIQGRVINNGI